MRINGAANCLTVNAPLNSIRNTHKITLFQLKSTYVWVTDIYAASFNLVDYILTFHMLSFHHFSVYFMKEQVVIVNQRENRNTEVMALNSIKIEPSLKDLYLHMLIHSASRCPYSKSELLLHPAWRLCLLFARLLTLLNIIWGSCFIL